MSMRDFIIALMTLIIVILGTKIITMDVRVRNVEQAIKRCEAGYQVVVDENKKLQRINEQNFRIMAEGGFDALAGNSTDN